MKSSYASTAGYHARTTKVHYVAMTPPPSKTELLFDHDLSQRAGRVANLVHLIQLSGVLAWLGKQVKTRGRPEFVPFERYVATLIRQQY